MTELNNLNNLLLENSVLSTGFIQLETNSITVNESSGAILINLVRVGGSEGEASVNYSTTDGTATKGSDYRSQKNKITFADGETTKTIRLRIFEDTIVEGNETFSLLIGEAVGAELGAPRSAIITIEDNDVAIKPTINFSQTKFSVDENAKEAVITLVRQGAIDTTARVNLATVDNYAKANSSNYADYLSVRQTVTFAPGQTSKTVRIPILNDALSENNEFLNLVLSNPVNIELGVDSKASLTIVDDDKLPSGFIRETVVSGLKNPTGFDWLDNNKILVAELEGKLRVFDKTKGQLLQTPFLDISDIVNIKGQRGLLSLAVHPDFPNNPYIYLGYSYDSPEIVAQEGADQDGFRDTRLVRVTADPKTNYTTAIAGSEVVLMTIPKARTFHASAGLRFGLDGSLFYAHGDGNVVGNLLTKPQDFTRLDYPFGKLYRINPMTGQGYEDNPFYTGNSNDTASKVYSYGFRNPFRIAIHPETGEPYIGDVGSSTWEEVNTGRGANFGWPYFEGGNGESLKTPEYGNSPKQQYIYENPNVTAPILAYNHSDNFMSMTLGDFYDGDAYPEIFEGALFLADFGKSHRVEAVILDESGKIETSILFDQLSQEGLTQMLVGPDGYLYATNLQFGQPGSLIRWTYQPSEEPVLIPIQGSSTYDRLTGTDRAENIQGFQKTDVLIGGGGADHFTYTSVEDGSDIIKDFTVGEDKINLTALLDSVGYIGSNPIADRWLWFVNWQGNAFVRFDADGPGGTAKARSLIELKGISVADINNPSNFIF